MDMQIDASKVRAGRERRAWSQEQLAEVTGLSMRTIQRVETSGAASFETAKAIAAVYESDVALGLAAVALDRTQVQRQRRNGATWGWRHL